MPKLVESVDKKDSKMNIITKYKCNYIDYMFIFQNNLLVHSGNFTLYNIDTLEIISQIKNQKDLACVRKMEITPLNEILILSGGDLSLWKLNFKLNKMEHIFTVKKVYSFVQNKIKNEIIIYSKNFSIIDYSGKILFAQKENPIIEFEYKIKPKKTDEHNFDCDNDEFEIDEDDNFYYFDYNNNEFEGDDGSDVFSDAYKIIIELFNNNKNFFILEGETLSSGDPYEPCSYENYSISIYNSENCLQIYNSDFYDANLKKITEKYLCDNGSVYYFDFEKREMKNGELEFKETIKEFYYIDDENVIIETCSNSLYIINTLKWEIKEKIEFNLNKYEYLEFLLVYEKNNNKKRKFIGKIFSSFSFFCIGESNQNISMN